jgi:hypothetical protein
MEEEVEVEEVEEEEEVVGERRGERVRVWHVGGGFGGRL